MFWSTSAHNISRIVDVQKFVLVTHFIILPKNIFKEETNPFHELQKHIRASKLEIVSSHFYKCLNELITQGGLKLQGSKHETT